MDDEHFPEDVKKLIDLLGEPEEGELTYAGKERAMCRLDALRELKCLELKGIIKPPKNCGGVNTHIHTNESFSIFRSPTEAAWTGYRAGLEVLGINDHYTIAGHKEFGEACRTVGLKPIFAVEIMALSIDAKKTGERYNDPTNPGRIYLCGKGVTHDLMPGSPSETLLADVRAAFKKRCKKMTEKAESALRDVDPDLGISFENVLRLTPRGNVTERHVAQAITELINRRFPEETEKKRFLRRLLGNFKDEEISVEGKFQDFIRNRLLKAGGQAYVEEPPEAFPSLERTVQLFKDYGAIPTYPVLGNPVTEKERDLDMLFHELAESGIFAIEVIPFRNTRERLKEILDTAEKHGFPVFNGTEHNTKTPQPILDELSMDPSFLPVFKRGAYLVLGHQFSSKNSGRGYMNREKRSTIEHRKTERAYFSSIGEKMLP